jgi:hypothetical protein
MTLFGWPMTSVLLIVFGASIVRGCGGFGFALVSVPLLATTIQPRDAVVLSIGLQILVGLYDARSNLRIVRWPLLRPLLLGTTLATPIGYLGLLMMAPRLARGAIAITAILAIILMFVKKIQRLEGALTPLAVGTMAGLMNGLAAMPGPPILAFFLKSGISSELARASMIVFFLASSLLAAASVTATGGWSTHILELIAVSVPAMVLGNWLGKMLFFHAPPSMFRRVVLTTLIASAAVAVWKSISS